MSYTAKTWADYPDISTPIMASDLNRIEQGISSVAESTDEIAEDYQTKSSTSDLILTMLLRMLWGVYPEYEYESYKYTIEDESDITMSLVFDLSVYNPDEYDGLILYNSTQTKIIHPGNYTMEVRSNAGWIHIKAAAGLEIGDTLTVYIFRKPTTSATATYGTATAVTEGTTVSADGTATATTTGTTVSVYGVAEEVTDEDSTDTTE